MSKDTGFSISSAGRYSFALFELSEENNLLSQIEEQSLSVLNLINQSKDFLNLIKDPTTSQEDLSKVINKIADINKLFLRLVISYNFSYDFNGFNLFARYCFFDHYFINIVLIYINQFTFIFVKEMMVMAYICIVIALR